MTRVCVVGGGAIGLFLAHKLSELGIEYEIFEEHGKAGEAVQCAGLVSKNLDKFIALSKNCVLNTVKGARLYSPGGKVLELSRKEDQAYVIDRAGLDEFLAEGLDVNFNKKITEIPEDFDYVVGADGPLSTVAKLAGFPELEEVLFGAQYEIKNENYGKDFVEMYFGKETAPSFFAWIIPTDSTLRVGLATPHEPKEYLDKFLEKKFGKTEILSAGGGVIPVRWRSKFTAGNVALVGDSAGQVKPSTGGGICMGMRSARILANSIRDENLDSYESMWSEEILPELNYSLLIRKFMKNLPDSEMDKVWELLNRKNIKKIILEHGDMDNYSGLIKSAVKSPALLKFLPYFRYILD